MPVHHCAIAWRPTPAVLASALLLLLVLLTGCTTQQPYRLGKQGCVVSDPFRDKDGNFDWEVRGDDGRPCGDASSVSVNKPVPFSVDFVEFDDQGVFADRRQVEEAIQHAAAREDGGSYVVVFIPGWHHNARPGDGNVRGFYDMLASLSNWNPKRKVKGIYIGWRGESLDVPLVKHLTFWDRKGTSDEVGRGALLELLLRLEREVKLNKGDDNKLALIGHSFGASVTFNALAHVYLSRFLDGLYSTETAPRFRGYGDLVVLVNPAIEAMRYMPFQSALKYYARDIDQRYYREGNQRQLSFAHEKQPALVILSSADDLPTRRLFPIGRLFTTAFEAHARVSDQRSPDETKDGHYSEWNMDQRTVANYWDFQTHATIDLAPSDASGTPMPEKSLEAGLRKSCRSMDPDEVRRQFDLPEGTSDASSFLDSRIRARRLSGQGVKGIPYVVAAVDERIVEGHNDIGGLNLLCWINQLMNTQEQDDKRLDAPVFKQGPAASYQ
ncbi:MAG: hypothetical protein ABW220_08525 [Burkholderiaceae bacterium]